jgi:twitching motility two-component system response regulator PilG
MNSTRPFSVTILGFSAYEQKVLRSILRLSSSRPCSYTLAPSSPEHTPDIVIVDGDDQQAMATWRTHDTRDMATPQIPAVLVSERVGPPDIPHVHLKRPIVAPSVMKALDQLAQELELRVAAAAPPPPKALVVDDSLVMRKQVTQELHQCGVEVDGAESGEQAWTYLQNGTAYALIFLDVVLPGVDGYTLCKTLKKDAQYKHIPVVMLTGKDSPFDRVRGKLARCDMYLTKPVTHEQLQTVIKQHLPQVVVR